MDRVRAARGATVAGIATLVLSWWFTTQAAVACSDGGPVSATSALGAFQMARNPEAVSAAIGCTERLHVLNSMNRADLIAFIPSYGLLVVLATVALASGRLRRVALLLFGIALLGDVVETATQLWIGGRWPFVTQPMMGLLAAGSAAKFAGLSVGCGALGLAMLQHLRGMTRWLGLGVAVFGLLGLTVFVKTGAPFLSLAILLLVAACAINARRRKVEVS
ncbi:hypothetical protein [Glacieibacterium sp.]|uniref:hypothetical protein n=1 Tax=Glacieibacterium sp. TaxID=2860237 RepID=UPI003B006B65